MSFRLAEAIVSVKVDGIPQAHAQVNSLVTSLQQLSYSQVHVAQSTSQATQAISQFSGHAATLRTQASGAAKGINSIGSAVASASQRMRGAQGVFMGFGTFFVGRALLHGIEDVIGGSVKLASQFEQAQVAMEVFTGSAEKAKAVLAEMTKFSVAAPTLQFPDVLEAGKQLMAYGFAAERVVPTLRMLGDVAAGLNLPLTRLVYLYGKVATEGRVMSRDLMQFSRAGVPIIETLSKAMNVSTGQFRTMVSQGQVSFSDLTKAFQTLTGEGGRFYQMQERQSRTVIGAWNVLVDTVGVRLREIGQRLNAAFDWNKIISGVINFGTAFTRQFQPLGELLITVASKVIEWGGAMLPLIAAFGAFVTVLITAATVMRTFAMLLTFISVLSTGGAGLAAVAVAAAAAAVTFAAATAALHDMKDEMASIRDAASQAGGGVDTLADKTIQAAEAARKAAEAHKSWREEMAKAGDKEALPLHPDIEYLRYEDKIRDMVAAHVMTEGDAQELLEKAAHERDEKTKKLREEGRERGNPGIDALEKAEEKERESRLSAEERELRRADLEAEKAGANPTKRGLIRGSLLRAQQNEEDRKAAEKHEKDIEKLREKTLTPQEKMNEELKKLGAMWDAERNKTPEKAQAIMRGAEGAVQEFVDDAMKDSDKQKSQRMGLTDLAKNIQASILDSEAKALAKKQAQDIANMALASLPGGDGLLVQFNKDKLQLVLGD